MAAEAGGRNALQQLLQDWLDAEPGRTLGDLAAKAGVHRNTFYAMAKRDQPKDMPDEETMRAMARAMELPYRQVVFAAVAATYHVERIDIDGSPNMRAIVAHLEEKPDEVQKHVLRIVKTWDENGS
ncbi:MAG TPA: hypothetical protein VFX33_02660 [Actinomycetales bacterium]|nr:hypothetical protein [Actinomycetales bacterium]